MSAMHFYWVVVNFRYLFCICFGLICIWDLCYAFVVMCCGFVIFVPHLLWCAMGLFRFGLNLGYLLGICCDLG